MNPLEYYLGPAFSGASITMYAIILFVLWIVVRELRTWYWKINELIRILKSIDGKLDAINYNILEGFDINDESIKEEPPKPKNETFEFNLSEFDHKPEPIENYVIKTPKKTLMEILNKKIF